MDKQTITIYDVAREAGVSMATVSRVVNGNPNVKPSTRKKVSEVIERLDYRPNAVARGLASKKTTTVGVIIPNVTNLFFSSLARGIDDIASMYKYNIILANSDENPEKELQVFNTLLAKQVDGIIFMGYHIQDHIRQEVSRTRTPVVFAGTVLSETDLSMVNIDYRAATREVTEYLLGHKRRVALVTGSAEYDINRDFRLAGYKEALAQHNVKVKQDLIIQKNFSYSEGDKIAAQLLAAKATAAVVSDDEIAIAISNALYDRGIKVPEEFEIITSNNSMLTQIVRPQLSSIQLPLYDIGAVAMRLLTKIMNNEEVEQHQIILPHKFIQRGSTLSDN
ncbi:catabolite control protein A [Aerococcaceae bacterium NML191292]|nr:catabolite control protein A [Aerococcaceae bacterium NML210727]MCW6655467.1 catabolite control protein A [Aerococcaceae bacterium NML201296]MCW6660540.1 catabolite control protein A [Aerococcaceae bacterium NML191292]MCW6661963.1 catabolite control protein A [Aerococcaceae bacterium NML201209]MCW6663509.1 catabolite control protein A [Aerococcaceae bacterium NML190073]MCW6665907.1 catabolite control protein A [Aerococcaceae bacterium NML191219]MCW6666854.1 catabolite control protein A [Ae